MRSAVAVLAILVLMGSDLVAAIQTQVIEYKQGDTVLEGLLAWDDTNDERKPAVIVVHEWWGNNDYSRRRAEQLAELGYVGFAIDLYGKGKLTTDAKQAGEWAGAVKADLKTARARVEAAIEILKSHKTVDPDKIAAIGYCFGGSMVLQMARWNLPVAGVVSFHGALGTDDALATQSIKPRILVCHGAEDTFISAQEMSGFIDEMRRRKADWQLITYGGAVHSFTNPNADKAGIPGVSYNKLADQRSWRAMQSFLGEVFSPGRR